MSSSPLQLNCCLLGGDSSRVFTVEIASTKTVATLKESIKDKKQHALQHVDADGLDLWKVSFPDDDHLQQKLKVMRLSKEHELRLTSAKLSKVFIDPPEEGQLHIVARRPSSPPSRLNPSDRTLLLDSTNTLSHDFSHLSVDDADASIGNIDLIRVSPELDTLTDDEHEALDAKILKMFSANRKFNEEPTLSALLSNITHEDERMESLTMDEAGELLRREPSIKTVLRNAWRKEAFKEVRQLEILWLREPSVTRDTHQIRESTASLLEVPIESSALSTELSWTQPFVGDAAEALWHHIKTHHHQHPSGGSVYAHYAAVVQSSGMGKSRTVDEMGRNHFVIPINLRLPHSQGFPASDVDVHRFLTNPHSPQDALLRAHSFLTSLFLEAAETVRQLRRSGPLQGHDFADKFRMYMTDGQKMYMHNANRREFYGNVVRRANQMLDYESRGYDAAAINDVDGSPPKLHHNEKEITVTSALDDLIRVILDVPEEDDSPCPSPRIRSSGRLAEKARKEQSTVGDPVIVLAWDEAHTLIDSKNMSGSIQPWSAFSKLRRALRYLNEYRLFSLFLSTTGKMTQFVSVRNEDSSTRVQIGQLSLIMPFTDLGFDQLAAKISLDGSLSLEDVAVIGHMVTLGRPLFALRYIHATDDAVRERVVRFAEEKLLNGKALGALSPAQELACLSQRMPIEFYSTTYNAQKAEQQQVEAHMRVCLKVLPGFENMVTVSPSEPILSEAASNIMSNPSFDAPKVLQRVLRGFSIHRGDRGEFVVMLLFTLSRDKVIFARTSSTSPSRVIFVKDFLKKLFQKHGKILSMLPSVARPENATHPLEMTFGDARLHFNHFIKVHQHRIINRKYLVRLLSRGAAALCANSQAGVDGVIPFLFRGSRLEAKNVGAILWQSKAGEAYGDEPVRALFDAMDPYKLGVFDPESEGTPVIRIVFALGGRKPSVKVLPFISSESSYTSYDIWCSGVSSDYLAPIAENAVETWESLVAASHGWQDVYDTNHHVTKALRMSMNPGAAENSSFWAAWST